MFRLTQIIRNLFIRFEAWFGVVLQSFANLFKKFFGFFAKVFGLTSPNYFLESTEVQDTKQTKAEQPTATIQNSTTDTPTTVPRRANSKLDNYYLNMARDVKKN
ncbi:MAG: threonine dehydratase [Goleter apudmare HA4340-LM2]|nr:threonine dehydratase [Goleter apudmare HA4340-LM2]